MSDEQREWLNKNPDYSAVQRSIVTIYQWVDQGYLWQNGKFSIDDGNTLFVGVENAIRVGRKVEIV